MKSPSNKNDQSPLKHRYVKEFFRILLAFAILPVFWPVAVVSVILLCTARFVIQKILNFIYGKNKYKLVSSSSSDGIFGHKSTGNSAIIHSFTVHKGVPDLESIRNRYGTHVWTFNDPVTGNKKIYEKFKWNLTTKLGFYCWHDASPTFEIKKHVRILDSIRPNEVFTEDKLMTLMGKLMSQDLSQRKNQPLWDHLIIPNYRLNHENPDSRPDHFVSIFRVHHAYADGASFAILMDSVLADRPLKYCMDPLKPFPGMTKWKEMFIHLKALTVGPLDFIMTLKQSITDTSPLILRKYSKQKFVDWSKPISLDLLKKIKIASGTSLGSVLVSSLTGSLRNLHERIAQTEAQRRRIKRFNSITIPDKINVGNMVVMLPYPSREMQNHFTTFSVPYPLSEENHITRLKMSDKIGRNYLGSSEPWFHFYVMRFSSICPKFVQDILLELPAAPIVFSNIPGIQEKFKLFDRELVDIGAWLPLFKAYGMAISTYSYCNKVRICVTSDFKLFENQAQLKSFIKDIEEGIYNLARHYGIEETTQNVDGLSHFKLLKNNYHQHNNNNNNARHFQFSDNLKARRLSATRCITNG